MKNKLYRLLSLIIIAGVVACNGEVSEIPQAGNPTLEVSGTFSDVHFGDLLPFSVKVNDNVPLSTLTVKLYFGAEVVSQTVIRTKTNGTYEGHIAVPFLKDIPAGTALLDFTLTNTTLKTAHKTVDVLVSRAQYPYLMLVAGNTTYPMLPTGNADEYAATEPFPSTELSAYIKAPAVDAKGTEITFGWESGSIKEGSKNNIAFVSKVGGTYSVTFNTRTYQAAPFFEVLMNGKKMNMLDKENFAIDIDLAQGEEITVEGLDDVADWWIDADFFEKKATAGQYKFLPIGGKYRITANLTLKYFRVEALDGTSTATLKTDGTGAVWVIGDNVGKPSMAALTVGWTTSKALCMAPIGNKKYQLTLVGGTNIGTESINFKFFHQKGWGGEFKSTTLTTDSDLIFVGNGTNGRDNGNLGIVSGKALEVGATYVFTIDLSAGIGSGVLTVTKQ